MLVGSKVLLGGGWWCACPGVGALPDPFGKVCKRDVGAKISISVRNLDRRWSAYSIHTHTPLHTQIYIYICVYNISSNRSFRVQGASAFSTLPPSMAAMESWNQPRGCRRRQQHRQCIPKCLWPLISQAAWLQSLDSLDSLAADAPHSAGEAVCHGWCSCRPLLQGAWELVYCMKAKFLEHVFDGKLTDRWGTQRHLMKHMGVPFVSEGTPHIAAPFGKQWVLANLSKIVPHLMSGVCRLAASPLVFLRCGW